MNEETRKVAIKGQEQGAYWAACARKNMDIALQMDAEGLFSTAADYRGAAVDCAEESAHQYALARAAHEIAE